MAIVASAIGIVLTLRTNRAIARRRATFDLLMAEQTDEKFLKDRSVFIGIRNDGRLTDWLARDKASSPESQSIRSSLNSYEFAAGAIREGVLDGNFYKRSYRTTFVRDWIALRPFVMQLRLDMQLPTLYCEFEALARKWAQADEKKSLK